MDTGGAELFGTISGNIDPIEGATPNVSFNSATIFVDPKAPKAPVNAPAPDSPDSPNLELIEFNAPVTPESIAEVKFLTVLVIDETDWLAMLVLF